MAFKSIEEAIESQANNLMVSILQEASAAAVAAAAGVLRKHGLPSNYGRKAALEDAVELVHVDAGINGKQVIHGIIRDRLIKNILKGASVD